MARKTAYRLPPEQMQRAIAMYAEGLSTHTIALALGNGINQEKVRKELHRAGVEMRSSCEGNQMVSTRAAHRRRRLEQEAARRAKP